MKNHYEVLGVSRGAPDKEIKKAYFKLAKKYHPDHNVGDAQAAKIFEEVAEAYRVLSDKSARENYDKELERAGSAKSSSASSSQSGARQAKRKTGAAPTSGHVDFENMARSFASFYGFDPKTKTVTDEDKMGAFVPKQKKKNPLDMSDMFERFMGFKK